MTEGELWTMNQVTNSSGHDEGIHLASLNWEEVGLYLIITFFIIFSGLAKVAFHNIHWLSSRVPESCLLVVVGVITGSIVYQITDSNDDNPSVQDTRIDDDSSDGTIAFPQFDASLFFYILLPPIILEASYSLYDKAFFDNLSTILVMAVIGTAINFLLIGFLLYFIWSIGAMGTIEAADGSSGLQLLHVLLFAALISAVDPVAVLAIFQEVGVNPDLYFLVFGESLLNDGVAVVFYKSMSTLAAMQDPIDPTQYVMMVGSFFSIALGGLLIGILVGFLTALMTKTMSEVRVMEPLALLSMAYFAYMAAEVFHWSGIISMIGCGIVQAHYAFPNISRKSHTTVKYFIKMVSSISDIVIFLFLGIAVVKGVPNNSNSSVENQHQWHTGFVVWTIALCLICRFLSVYGLTWLANRRRVKTINLQEQFIMAYGGLRGAVGFSLVDMIDRKVVPLKNMFVTTTLIVVMFTIFFQGMTIKFLVNLLNIEKKKDRTHLISEVMNDTVLEHIVSGIDAVSGHRGRQYWQTLFEYYDEHYLKKIFCKQRPEHDLQRLFEKLALSDHLLNLYGPTLVHEEGQSGMLLEPVKAIDLLDEDDENMSTSSSPGPGSFRRARTSGKHRDPELSQPLTSQDPPPLPPRSSNHSFKPSTLVHNLTASFRRRNHTIDLPTIASSASQTEDELRLSPRKGPNELSLVRHAFQSGSQRVGTFSP